ncbi:hypothetical protein FOY91_10820 [Sphingomonas solaris]|uniref:Uncharacterized protein n=1 Tax=Alterirhizorhabdus solaris TaxID=2529389 RepID=A0A558R3X9_9SPHN|nr:hypothetical protein FOY91_10820 [Sphingomonas solaris]
MSRSLILGLLLAAAAMPAAAAPARDNAKGEASLAKMLAGRVPGPPVDCLTTNRIQSSEIVDRTAIVYRVGGTLYVNRPQSGVESLDRGDILVISTSLPQLCSIDVVRLIDQTSRFHSGFVGLGPFVPYARPDAK